MTKLEKALENIEDVKRVLIQEFCPAFFGLKNNCNIARDCEKCWNQEADEMTHTPEKWYVGYDQEYDIDAGDDGRTIGYPTGRDEFDGTVFVVTGEDQVEIIAEHIRDEKTAHQIKAIPYMLAALEEVMGELDVEGLPCPLCGRDLTIGHRRNCIWHVVASAVRKARGEE